MPQRCQDCRHWTDSVFLGEGANGGACWEGNCGLGVGTGPRGRNSHRDKPRHSLMLACDRFEIKPVRAPSPASARVVLGRLRQPRKDERDACPHEDRIRNLPPGKDKP